MRYTKKENGSYTMASCTLEVGEDVVRGTPIDLLGRLEDLLEGLKIELEDLEQSLVPYKKEGKIKNYRGKELLGRKLILHNTISVLESYGIEVQYGKNHFDKSEKN